MTDEHDALFKALEVGFIVGTAIGCLLIVAVLVAVAV